MKPAFETERQNFAQNSRNGEHQKGVLDARPVPDTAFDALWDAIILDHTTKDRLLSQAILNFTLRGKFDQAAIPLHGIILLVGPPGTPCSSRRTSGSP